ncbi:MAG TPA: hypothetical protein VGP25_22280 [Gemmatimonadaceae bacterium]|nr:hypothetical protein [Gemmatimonadaceae bacterium]
MSATYMPHGAISRSSWRAPRTLLVVGLVALASGSAAAQGVDAQAGVGALFERYTFGAPVQVDLEKISLLTIPVTARVALSPKLELGVNGAFATATRSRRGGQTTTLSGLVDTDIHLSYQLAGDRIRLTATAVAPTGKSKLTADEMEVAGLIASDLLPFAISNWGEGGGVGLSAAVTLPVSDDTKLGVSGGYLVGRSYEPLSANTFAYRPGNQLQARASIDQMIGITAKASLQVTYLHYAQDQTAGTNFYQAGDRLQALGSVAFAAGGDAKGIAYVGYLQRKLGKFTSVVDFTPAQNLVYVGTGVRQPYGQLTLVPSIDARFLSSDQGVGQGRNVSAGLSAELPMGDLQVVPQLRGRFGKLMIRTGQESTFKGFELGLGIRHQAVSR